MFIIERNVLLNFAQISNKKKRYLVFDFQNTF